MFFCNDRHFFRGTFTSDVAVQRTILCIASPVQPTWHLRAAGSGDEPENSVFPYNCVRLPRPRAPNVPTSPPPCPAETVRRGAAGGRGLRDRKRTRLNYSN